MDTNTTRNWLTPAEVSAHTGLSISFLFRNRHGLNAPLIPFTKIGRRVLYGKADVDTFLKASDGHHGALQQA